MSFSAASLSLAPLTAETAEPAASGALEATAKRLGFIPNMYGYMAYAPDLLNTYLAGYEGFRRNSGFSPAEQETVFLAVSEANGCDYCVAAHSMIAEKMSKVPADSIAALRTGAALPDPRLQALAAFTRTMVETAGRPTRADVDAFIAAGFEPGQVFAVILAIGVKTFSNYTNHVVATKLDPAFAAYEVTA
jgi:uncharacterized peroxidase-related enzyme